MPDVVRPRVAITGANGYIGSIVRARCEAQGLPTLTLVRSPRGEHSRPYELGALPAPDLLEGVDVLIHCAWDLSQRRRRDVESMNVAGTRRLFQSAQRAHVSRIVFISSMSAYIGTQQRYGSAKLDAEQAAFEVGGYVARLGVVYGPHAGGMAGALRKLTALPLTPLIAGDPRQFTVHEDDAAEAIVRLATAENVPHVPLGVAHPEAVPFRALLEEIAASNGRKCRYVSLPWRGVYQAIRVAEALRVPLPFRADSLLGLVKSAPMVPNVEQVRRLGIDVRPLGGRSLIERNLAGGHAH